MKRLSITSGAFFAALWLVVGAGSGAAASKAPSIGAKVSVASTKLGPILVDKRGHTLYLFGKDKRGKSTCAGACAAFWPPLLTSGKPLAGPGVRSGLLGTTRRSDGRLQVTYNHHPLYTFVKDMRKGDTTGEGLNVYGAEWYALSGAGAKVESGSTDTGGNGSSSGGYGSDNGY
jgi:predicted lipoprotein with Yx(FWY)xxD motif